MRLVVGLKDGRSFDTLTSIRIRIAKIEESSTHWTPQHGLKGSTSRGLSFQGKFSSRNTRKSPMGWRCHVILCLVSAIPGLAMTVSRRWLRNSFNSNVKTQGKNLKLQVMIVAVPRSWTLFVRYP